MMVYPFSHAMYVFVYIEINIFFELVRFVKKKRKTKIEIGNIMCIMWFLFFFFGFCLTMRHLLKNIKKQKRNECKKTFSAY